MMNWKIRKPFTISVSKLTIELNDSN